MGLYLAERGVTSGPTIAEYSQQVRDDEQARRTKTLALSPLLLLGGAADTVGQSVGLIDEGSMAGVFNTITENGGDIYSNEGQGFRMAADVATAFIGAGAAAKAMRVGSFAHKALSNMGKAGKLASSTMFSSPQRVEAMTRMYRRQAEILGKHGISNLRNAPQAESIRKTAQLRNLGNNVTEGVAGEIAIYVGMNESDLFFPEGQSMKDVALMSAAGIGVFGAVGQVVLGGRLKKIANVAGRARSGLNEQLVGNPALDVIAAQRTIERVAAGPDSTLDETSRGLFNQQAVNAQAVQRKAIERLYAAKPVDGINESVTDVSLAEINAVREMAQTDPRTVANIVSIDRGSSLSQVAHKADLQRVKLQKEITVLKGEMKKAEGGQLVELMTTLRNKQSSLDNINRNTTFVARDRAGILHVERRTSTSVFHEKRPVISPHTIKGTRQKPAHSMPYYGGIYGDRKKTTLGMSANGKMFRGGKEITTTRGLSSYDRSKFYDSMQRAIEIGVKALKATDDSVPIDSALRLTKGSDALQFDYVLSLLNHKDVRNNVNAVDKLVDLSEFGHDLKAVQQASIAKKYELFVSQMNSQNKKAASALDNSYYAPEDFSTALNLRMHTDHGEMSAAYEWFHDLYTSGVKSFDDAVLAGKLGNFDDMLTSFMISASSGATPNSVRQAMKDNKASFRNLLLQDVLGTLGKKQEPLLLTVRRTDVDGLAGADSADYLEMAKVLETQRIDQLTAEIQEFAPHLVPIISDVFERNSDIVQRIVSGSGEIVEGANDAPLIRKLGFLGINTTNFKVRHVPAAAEMSNIGDMVQRRAKQWASGFLQNNTSSLASLLKPANRMSKQQYLSYNNEFSRGWKFSDDVFTDDGLVVLSTKAEDQRINETVAKQMGLKEVPTHVPDPLDGSSNVPLRLDKLARKAVREDMQVSGMLLGGNHAISRATGRGGVPFRAGHVVQPDLGMKEMVFITDEKGRVISFASGATEAAARKEAQRFASIARADRIASGRSGAVTIVGKDQVEQYKALRDQAWNSSAIDTSDAFALSGGRQAEGGRPHIVAHDDFIKSKLNTMNDLLVGQANKTTEAYFAPTLENMRNSQAVGGASDRLDSAGRLVNPDVFDISKALLTNRTIDASGSLLGKVDNIADDMFNSTLNGIRQLYDDAGFNATKQRKQRVELEAVGRKIAREHGFDPNTAALRLAERATGQRAPANARKIAQVTSAVTQAIALKFMELGHPLLTTASVMTTTPHTLQALSRLHGESDEAWKLRTGLAQDFLENGETLPNATMHTTKVLGKYIRGDYKDVLEEATELGYLQAPVGEFMLHLSSDVQVSNAAKWARKVGDFMSKPTVWSEDFARAISFVSTYDMLANVGKSGKHVSMAAANDFANRTIADYRPVNRAQLFQGTLGTPLSLFQSFAINYFEKLYKTVEDKDVRRLLNTYGTQAFVFGGSSVAGYDIMNETVLNTWDGSHNPERALRDIASKDWADFFLYGTLSNLPKLLGAEDGVALYTRGEMQTPRVLSPLDIANAPFPSMGKRVMNVISGSMSAAAQEGGISLAQVRESFITAMPSRPIKGMLELAQGYSTNANGDLIDQDVRSLMGVASRFVAMKPMMEAEKAKQLWLDREGDLSQRAAQRRLNRTVTGLMRSDKLDSDKLVQVFESYIANGGTERGFKRWFKGLAIKSVVSKADRTILEKLKSNPRGREFLRFNQIMGDES